MSDMSELFKKEATIHSSQQEYSTLLRTVTSIYLKSCDVYSGRYFRQTYHTMMQTQIKLSAMNMIMHNQHLKSISDLKKQVKRQQTLHLDSTTKIKDLDTGLKSMDENMTSLKKELDSTNQNLKNTRLQLESELMEHSITIIQNSTRITTLEYWRINGQRLISVLFFMLLRFKKSAWFVGLLWSGLKGVSSSTSSSSSIWKRRVYNCLQILSVGWIVYQFKAYTHFKQYFMVKRVLKNETD